MSKKALKPKACKGCGTEFQPRVSTQVACSPVCALNLIAKRKFEKAAKEERKADKVKREALKSRSSWLSDAQAMFNKYIRLRDAKQPCISCGKTEATWDAGHYRTVAAAPNHRFNEDNVHKQCVQCNQHKSGNIVQMRMGMIERIGEERVKAIEYDNNLNKLSIDDIKSVKETYKQKIIELQKANNA